MRGFTALINPISGGGAAPARWGPVAQRLTAAGAAVREQPTRSRAHAVESATEAARRGDVVVAVGGDGLVRDVAAGVVAAGGKLAIVPAGRGNDFAALLGIGPDPQVLADMLLHGGIRRVDVVDVNGVIAPGNVYIGIDSVATRLINAGRWMPALLTYRWAPVRAIASWRPPEYTLVADGVSRRVRAHTVVVAKSGAYGHGLRIVPSARLDDGLAHVMVVGAGPRRAVVRFMSQAKRGSHIARPEVEVSTVRQITVDADRPVPVCADGDEVTTLPARIEVRPEALAIVVPTRTALEQRN
jgi:diacylglycerol kinase (ATP)